MKIKLQRVDEAFNMRAVDELGHEVFMDSSVEKGGQNKGVRPMSMLIMGMGGCAAIDVVLILKKQRQVIKDLNIELEAERERDKEPALWSKVNVRFILNGDIDKKKAEKAVSLSMEKYCSVAETLRKAGTAIAWETEVLTKDTATPSD